jgi:hypothetical protein
VDKCEFAWVPVFIDIESIIVSQCLTVCDVAVGWTFDDRREWARPYDLVRTNDDVPRAALSVTLANRIKSRYGRRGTRNLCKQVHISHERGIWEGRS